MFRARFTVLMVVGLGLTLQARTAFAQESFPDRLETATPESTVLAGESVAIASLNATSLISSSTAIAMRLAEAEQFPMPPMRPIVPQRPKTGGGTLLNSLYASTAMMQALDLHSTLKAFGAGATEGNPLMSGVTKNTAAFALTKAAVAAVTILATRKIAKKHKIAAVLTLVAVNSAYAMVVSRNYALARR